MDTVLQFSAPIGGFFLGTLLFARVGSWIEVIVTALKNSRDERTPLQQTWLKAVPVVILHSGPWLLAAVVYWAYHILSESHTLAWELFFGGVVASLPIWVAISIYLYFRGKRIRAESGSEKNAV